ncbi:MAG TPA: hypothetical protein VLA59_09435 [Patescibacteria group bacterium]|nr:hypothetical protein [Patescibacteria group bacterium]
MTTDRDIAPVIRSWLHGEPDEPTEHVLDRALAVVDLTPQRSAARWPTRRPDMNFIVRLGVAAAVLAMAVALGYGILQNVGKFTPEPDASDDASPASGALPPELRHIFIGATRDVPGIEVDDRLVIDLTASVFRLHTGNGQTALTSAASVVESGVLRLETAVGTGGCAGGDVGTYSYSFSPGATVLTVTSADDDCASRAEALVGEWRRSACRNTENWCLGELEAGSQASLFFDPYLADHDQPVTRYGAMTYEVPGGWANADDRTHFYTLMRASAYQEPGAVMGCLDCPDNIWFSANPRAIRMDCSEEVADEAIGASAEALADWIRANPGLQVSEGPAITVDGRQAFVFDVMAPEGYADACVDPELDMSLVPLFTHPGYTYAIGTGDRHRLVLVEIDAGTTMLIGFDTLDPADIDAFVAEVQPIVDSIELTAP